MGKIIDWVLSLTKLGKIVTPVQEFLDGKKSYLTGLGIAVPALVTILQNFSASGVQYLVGLPKTPEYGTLLMGLGLMFVRAAIAKATPQQ